MNPISSPHPDGVNARHMRRRGVSATLTTLFLLFFGCLAVGFYASVNNAIAIGDNAAAMSNARLASESGMEFARVLLARLRLAHTHDTDQAFADTYSQLVKQLEGTPNLNGQKVELSGNVIHIPGGQDQYIQLNATGAKFRVELERAGAACDLRVRVIGVEPRSSLSRTIRVDFQKKQVEGSALHYGMVSRGAVTMDANARITGAPTPAVGNLHISSSASPALSMKAMARIGGSVEFTNPAAQVTTATPKMILGRVVRGTRQLELPVIDPSVFKPFAGTDISGVNPVFKTGVMKNLYIKAGTNPTFSGNTVIQGVTYIETPNRVTFDANASIQGIICQQVGASSSPANQLIFHNATNLTGVETLPATEDFPSGLRELTGTIILAPSFALHFDGAFGVIPGTIVGGDIRFDGSAAGTIRGSVLSLGESLHLDGNAAITIDNLAATPNPAGLYFASNYVPVSSSYQQ